MTEEYPPRRNPNWKSETSAEERARREPPKTAQIANQVMFDAVETALSPDKYKALNDAFETGNPPESQWPFKLKLEHNDDEYLEFVLGDTTTNKVITYLRRYKKPGSEGNWKIYAYETDTDAQKGDGIEVPMHDVFEGDGAKTPSKPNYNRKAAHHPLADAMSGGRRRRRTRARKTRKRKTRRSRR